MDGGEANGRNGNDIDMSQPAPSSSSLSLSSHDAAAIQNADSSAFLSPDALTNSPDHPSLSPSTERLVHAILTDEDEIDAELTAAASQSHPRSSHSHPQSSTVNSSADDAAAASNAAMSSPPLSIDPDSIDDDELTILAVRRALHIPLHPRRQVVRRVHTPVDLVEEEEEEEKRKEATADGADATADGPPASGEEEEDVCAICLTAPTDPCVPSSCTHHFCFLCLEQWTRIQLTAIYQAQEERQRQVLMHGFMPEGSNGNKKSAPSCPMCKREYSSIRKLQSVESEASPGVEEVIPSAFPTNSIVSVESILPPPRRFHQPTLSFHHPAYAGNEYFRRAGEAGLNFVMRLAPTMRTRVVVELLKNHPRINALLTSYPPFRDRFRQVQHDLIGQIIQTRNQWIRQQQMQEQERQRGMEMMAVDRGAGLDVPAPVPMLSDSNAHQQLNRMSPYGLTSVLSLAFGQQAEPVYTNPTLQLYREARYQGGVTHFLGRMRMWSDLPTLQYVPPQPDLIWALRQTGFGRGIIAPFDPTAPAHSAQSVHDAQEQAAAAAASSSAAAPTAASSSASAAPLPTVSQWLNRELTSLLSSRRESRASSPSDAPEAEHFMVVLVMSYLELLLRRLELDEQEQAMKLARRNAERAERRKQKANKRREAAATADATQADHAANNVSASPPPVPPVAPPSSGSEAASSSMPVPALSSSFVPSYFSSSSSLHSIPPDAPTQLPSSSSLESAPSVSSSPSAPISIDDDDDADADSEVMVVGSTDAPRTRSRQQRPSSQPDPSDVIVIGEDDEDEDEDVDQLMRHATSPATAHLAGGHLHTLFALSTPLSVAVDFLFQKMEEFLRGFTGVFVHRLLLFILASAYRTQGSGPPPSRNATSSATDSSNPAPTSPRVERAMQQLLEHARLRWREDRRREHGNPRPATTSNVAPVIIDEHEHEEKSAHPPPSAIQPMRSPPVLDDDSPSSSPSSASSHHSPSRSPSHVIIDSNGAIGNGNGNGNGMSPHRVSPPPTRASLSPAARRKLKRARRTPIDRSTRSRSPSSSARTLTGDAIGAADIERRYFEEDAMLLSGMQSIKRPRTNHQHNENTQ